jgi:hypothetical protein
MWMPLLLPRERDFKLVSNKEPTPFALGAFTPGSAPKARHDFAMLATC